MIWGMSTQLVNPPLSEKKSPPSPPNRGNCDFFLIWKITEIQKGLRNDFRFMICGMSTQLVNPPLSEKKSPPSPHRQMGVTGIFLI